MSQDGYDYSPLLGQLVAALRRLPGVGAKSAQRMALHLLQRDRDGARQLGRALDAALDGIRQCETSRMYCEPEHCRFCSLRRRESGQLCVVENPADLLAIERYTDYRGAYYVLMGQLSPLDGIGPEELGLDRLDARLAAEPVTEMIIATSATVEGEATAHFLGEMARRHGMKVTRLAQGVPMGGELEYVDAGTLAHAFAGRRPVGD